MSKLLSDYNYKLPEHLVAHTPNTNKANDKLMELPLSNTTIKKHHRIKDLPEILNTTDLLIFNDTKVIPAKIQATRQSGANCEILLLKEESTNIWSAMIRNVKKVSEGETLIGAGNQAIKLLKKHIKKGQHLIQFTNSKNLENYLAQWGSLPLPPYIKENNNADFLQSEYQTTFAKKPGAIAAPTAGLHFTPTLIKTLTDKGIQMRSVTLHVGYGTFKPIETNDITHHIMHKERYYISPETADTINKAKSNNQRIIAIGTTVTRTLESATENGILKPGWGESDLFIYPGYKFKMIQGLLTNFHLPKSTLLCLVSALVGKNRMMEAYQEAIRKKYRFFSFGDAMLIH